MFFLFFYLYFFTTTTPSAHPTLLARKHEPRVGFPSPTINPEGQRRPTVANHGQRRPTKAHSTQRRPTAPNVGHPPSLHTSPKHAYNSYACFIFFCCFLSPPKHAYEPSYACFFSFSFVLFFSFSLHPGTRVRVFLAFFFSYFYFI